MDLLIQESEWEKRSNMLEDKDFEIVTEENPINDESITKDDFELVQVDTTVHEQKFQTRPTTFLKDSLKRFSKNKSSVVAAYILGTLLLMSFIVPIVDQSNTKVPHPQETYLSPKLFNAGAGIWDGTTKYSKIAVDISAMPNASTEEEKQEYWWPSASRFPQHSAISKKKFTEEQYTNDATNYGSEVYGREGYIQFGHISNEKKEYVEFATQRFNTLTLDENLYLTSFDVCDLDKIHQIEGKNELTVPENFELGATSFVFNYVAEEDETLVEKQIQLVEPATVHNIGRSEEKINISDIIKIESGTSTFENAYFAVRMDVTKGKNICSFIKSIGFETEATDGDLVSALDDMSFTDPTVCQTKTSADGYQYWSSTGIRRIYLSKVHFCSFVYDTYEAAFGKRTVQNFSIFDLLQYEKNGWISFTDDFGFPTLAESGDGWIFDKDNFVCKILNEKKCPLSRPLTIDDFYGYDLEGTYTRSLSVEAEVYYYRFLGYKTMPRYLFGTDKSGRDMFKYVFEGLRTSLLLGVLTFIVCFLFGLIYGSISGYFGGTVDLVMERITDILSGVPWIVVMTLIIIHMGSNFWTFALALCLTGWIGTAATTRTQFYRFRGREYVLASRTLGASDARLIAKHILPNALGTIITGSVLMIPSVIFSEATISYLGLGLKNVSSLGVILSDNQSELLTSSYLLIFPAIVIALVMISFNLFGNGLRDAINPSLKGEE